MKILLFAALLCVIQLLALPILAGDVNESDYPVQYEVMNSQKTSKLKIEKSCTMTLRDKAKPNVAINVAKSGRGSCQALDNGKTFAAAKTPKRTSSSC